jgi:putative glutamine amidotransferase
MKPTIGIASRRVSVSSNKPLLHGVYESYIRWLTADVHVVLLPVGAPSDDSDALPRLHGLVLPGGENLCDDTAASPDTPPHTGTLDPLRDASEAALARAAIGMGLPILGICRGLQVMGRVLGATVGPLPPGQADLHSNRAHDLSICDDWDGRFRHTGSNVLSNHSFHLADLGEELTPFAVASDHVVEGVRCRSGRPLLGVLWHPEVSDDPVSAAVREVFLGWARTGT